MPDNQPPRRDHERSDIDAKLIGQIALGVIAAAVLIHLGLWGLQETFMTRQGTAGMGPAALASYNPELNAWNYAASVPPPPMNQLPPPPRLQGAPARDLVALRAREDQVLTHYRVLDSKNGIISLPIDRAMTLLTQRGWPSTAPSVPPQAGTTP
jgi:hypothetical protein